MDSSSQNARSDSGDKLDLLSELEGLTDAEMEDIDERLAKHEELEYPNLDTATFEDFEFMDDAYPSPHIEQSAAATAPQKRSYAMLEVEIPLTPTLISSSTTKKLKSVSFPDEIRSRIEESPHDLSEADRAFFDEIINAKALEQNHRLQHEQLLPVDAKGRVSIPEIQAYHTTVPWEIVPPATLPTIIAKHFKSVRRWPGISKLERSLSWSVFPHELGKFVLRESVEDSACLFETINKNSAAEVISSEKLLYKPAGLKLLKCLSDMHEAELLPFPVEVEPEDQDLDYLVQQRKIGSILASNEAADTLNKHIHDAGSSRFAKPNAFLKASILSQSRGLINFGISAAIARFQETRGLRTKEPPNQKAGTIERKATPPNEIEYEDLDEQEISRPPLPALPLHLPTKSFIVSLGLLKSHRPLLQAVRRQYPNANFIERNLKGGLVGEDADVIVSPSTSFVFTTIQKVKQRALPGQPSTSLIKGRLRGLCALYSRVLCFVAEDSESGANTRELDDRDYDALCDLSTFACTLEADVQVIYVPGSHQDLASWVVSCMNQYGVSDDTGLLVEQTTVRSYNLGHRYYRCLHLVVGRISMPLRIECFCSSSCHKGTANPRCWQQSLPPTATWTSRRLDAGFCTPCTHVHAAAGT